MDKERGRQKLAEGKVDYYTKLITQTLKGETLEFERIDWGVNSAFLNLFEGTSGENRLALIKAMGSIIEDEKNQAVIIAQVLNLINCMDLSQLEPSVKKLRKTRAAKNPAVKEEINNFLSLRDFHAFEENLLLAQQALEESIARNFSLEPRININFNHEMENFLSKFTCSGAHDHIVSIISNRYPIWYAYEMDGSRWTMAGVCVITAGEERTISLLPFVAYIGRKRQRISPALPEKATTVYGKSPLSETFEEEFNKAWKTAHKRAKEHKKYATEKIRKE